MLLSRVIGNFVFFTLFGLERGFSIFIASLILISISPAFNSKNKERPLDCWEEVELFKDSVRKAQREFVAARQ